ncbi:MAG TPA: LysR substrate-binding domain-containing protein [Arenibaculum sp.]|nr:LysR substrate-binding domain-containing protein [Arenibaculum sp.]
MSLSGLSLRDLEYVVAIGDLHHFGKAADRCGVSQPSLSIQIRRLEERFGTTLFERSPRRVLVTPEGEALVAQARTVLQEAQRFVDLAHGHTERLSGPLRLGAIPTLGPYLFPRILRPLRKQFPELVLILHEFRTAELVERLKSGELDAAFLSPPLEAPGLVMQPIFFEPFLLIHAIGAEVAGYRSRNPNALPGEGLILIEEGHCLRDQALALCSRRPVGSVGRHATGLETLRHMVAAGEGWSIVPALSVPDPDPLGELIEYTGFERRDVGRWIVLSWRASAPCPQRFKALAAFLAGTIPFWSPPGGRPVVLPADACAWWP